MYQFGQQTADTYTPCDPFKQHVTDLFDEWMEFVESLSKQAILKSIPQFFNLLCIAINVMYSIFKTLAILMSL